MTLPAPTNDAFWQQEDNELWIAIDALVVASLIAGSKGGIATLPAGAIPLLNFELFNLQAIQFLNTYRLTTIPGINNTTRRKAIEAITRWILSGEGLASLEPQLALIFGDRRAAMIATTEVTRIFAQGNLMLWRSTGVIGAKKWQTARDERVCPICGPLDGMTVSINTNFMITEELLANSPQMRGLLGKTFTEERALNRARSLIKHTGAAHIAPPAHVNCILPGNKVSVPGRIAATTQAFYDGIAVELCFYSGRKISVTENHMILGQKGWARTKDLKEFDYIVVAPQFEMVSSIINPNDYNSPTFIEKIFASLKMSDEVFASSVPAAPIDFHSDGEFINGKIDIIYPRGFLGRYANIESTPQVGFINRDMLSPVDFSGFCPSNHFFSGNNTPFSSNMGRPNLISSLFGSHSSPLDSLSLGLSAKRNPFVSQDTSHSETPDPILARKFVNRFSGDVLLDQIRSIRKFNFSGHVYDLQVEPYNLYFTNGIITHNCRCWLLPVVSDVLFREQLQEILQ